MVFVADRSVGSSRPLESNGGQRMADERESTVAQLLDETESEHGAYEQEELGGQRDEEWASWYAGYALEHDIGDVLGTTPEIGRLAEVLTEATAEREREGSEQGWSEYAAAMVVDRLG
jgi:hypothetical protein